MRGAVLELENAITELEQATSVLGFMEEAFVHSQSCLSAKEAADVMCMLYLKQSKALKEIKSILGWETT